MYVYVHNIDILISVNIYKYKNIDKYNINMI